MTIHRLLLREVTWPLVLSLLLVSQLLVVMQMLQLNEVLFGSGFDPVGILRIASYLAPHFGIIALPLAFLLAVMLGLGRMNEDNELVALQAIGRSPFVLYLVPMAVGLVLGAAVAFLSFRGEPWGLRGIHRQLNELIKRNVAGDIRAGVFNEDIPRFTLFVGKIPPTGSKWEQVLLHDSVGDGTPLFLLARRGQVESEGADSVLTLDLKDGELHRFDANGAYTRARFETGSIALGVSDLIRRRNKFVRPAAELEIEEMPRAWREAAAAGDAGNARRIELSFHVRIASVLTCFVFGLIAVPLAAGGRGARGRSFAATVLAFAGYYIVQTISGGMAEYGRITPLVAAWIPNVAGLLVALVLGWRLRSGVTSGSSR